MRMVGACQALPRHRGDPGFVLALNDSRFGRFSDVGEATHWRVTFRKLGWQVRFCESDDLADGMAREFVRLASSAQASEYLRNIKANAMRGSRGAAGQGYWVSSAPFGYRRAVVYPLGRERILPNGTPKAKDEKIRLAVDHAESVIVRDAFDHYSKPDATLASTAVWLAERAPTRKWSVPAVRWMLGNRAYVGDVVIGRRMADEDDPGHVVVRATGERWGMDDAHEPIVSRDRFHAVQAKLKANADAPRRARSDYALSGILGCAVCGAHFVGGRTTQGKGYYRCKGSLNGSCVGSVARHLIEPAVVGALASTLSSPSMRRRIRTETERLLDGFTKPQADRSLADAEAKAVSQRDRLTLAVSQGLLSPDEAAATLATIRAELARIANARTQDRFAASRRMTMLADRETILKQVLDAPARLAGATASQIREHVAIWCQSMTYNRVTRSVRMEIRTAMPMLSTSRAGEACQNDAPRPVVVEVSLPHRKVVGAPLWVGRGEE